MTDSFTLAHEKKMINLCSISNLLCIKTEFKLRFWFCNLWHILYQKETEINLFHFSMCYKVTFLSHFCCKQEDFCGANSSLKL